MAITDKIEINFQHLDTKDPKYLTIADYSTWGMIESKPTIIEIILPGFTNPVTQYFKQYQINAFNSLNLGLNCVSQCGEYEKADLPDGVYEITIKGSPDTYSYTRKVLRTTLLDLELAKVFISAVSEGFRVNKNLFDKLEDIDALLSSAHSNVIYDNICRAQELYMEAKRLSETLKDCNICVGAQVK